MNTKKQLVWLFIVGVSRLYAQNPSCNFSVFEIHNNVTCPGHSDGSIDLTVTSDQDSTFSFIWSSDSSIGLNAQSEDQAGLLAGFYFVTVSDTSNCEVPLTIEILDGNDIIPPTIYCPSNIYFELPPGACDKVIDFDITAFDNCGAPVLTQTDTTGLSAGNAFPIGITTLIFLASDSFNVSTCSFNIEIVEYEAPGAIIMSCNQNMNAALDENCNINVNAQTFLNGNQYGCYDNYLIEFESHNGQTITPEDFPDHIGKLIYAQVTDPETGNSCYASLKLFDNLKPKIICPDTLIVSCGTTLAEVHPSIIGSPEVQENCGGYFLNYFNNYQPLACNDTLFNGLYSQMVERIWTASDEQGNVSSPCYQYILFERKSIPDIEFPLNRTDLPGALPSLPCDATDTSPAVTGVPMVDSSSIYQSNGYCDFSVNYTDVIFSGCGSDYDILRNWTVQDDCSNTIKSHLQIIRIKDQTPPTIICPEDILVSTNTGTCQTIMVMPQATVTDNCSAYAVTKFISAGFISGNLIMNIPVGAHDLTFEASDVCGNVSNCITQITVHDVMSPTVICNPTKLVSLVSNGTATVNASIFNNNSYDDCSNQIQFQARRINDDCGGGTDWNNTVTFCCADVGNPVEVELKVSDFSGNSNICSSTVLVSDQFAPNITCPTDVQISCGFDYSNISVFGTIVDNQANRMPIIINGETVGLDGIATDNCSVNIEELETSYDINNCGTGSFTRFFLATDPFGKTASCIQNIYIVNDNPFYVNEAFPEDPNDHVVLPPHLNLSGCNLNTNPAITGEPVISSTGCEEASSTFQDEILNIPGNAYQILRKWTIIDFCQFQGGGDEGKWHYTQVITVQNSDILPPIMDGLGEVFHFCSNDADCALGVVNFSLTATDNCSAQSALVWQHGIDLHNDGTVDISGTTNFITGTLPIGIHRTTWTVTDESGNTAIALQFLMVEDCLEPTAQCPNSLEVILESDGFASMTTLDVEQGNSFDNCTLYEELQFLISFHDENYNETAPPSYAADFLVFACPDSSYQIDLWVGDELENWDFCTFQLQILDENNVCTGNGTGLTINGNVRTETGQFIEMVEVNVNNTIPTPTSSDGNYAYYNLPIGGDFSVNPYKNTNHANGLTTFDMVLLRKHILGTELLDSPYKMIAADVNKSNTITTLDMVEIRKLILFINDEFSNNNSWRFIDANFEFPNPENPFETPFPEGKSFNNLATNESVDFIGIKVGDVNGSANPNE